MQFAVVAIASVPDTATTRRLYRLEDLDDDSVSKVLYHRRKQQAGAAERLRWDQRAIAGITLIQHAADDVRLQSLNLQSDSEQEMLQAYFAAAVRNGRMVFWGDDQAYLPLIRFRALLHGVSDPAYWQAEGERGGLCLDISEWLAPSPHDRPGLDETARRLGYPGLLGRDADGVHEAWLQRRFGDIQAFSELAALNSYLLALRIFAMTGEMAAHDSTRLMTRLREELRRLDGGHLGEFLAAWDAA